MASKSKRAGRHGISTKVGKLCGYGGGLVGMGGRINDNEVYSARLRLFEKGWNLPGVGLGCVKLALVRSALVPLVGGGLRVNVN